MMAIHDVNPLIVSDHFMIDINILSDAKAHDPRRVKPNLWRMSTIKIDTNDQEACTEFRKLTEKILSENMPNWMPHPENTGATEIEHAVSHLAGAITDAGAKAFGMRPSRRSKPFHTREVSIIQGKIRAIHTAVGFIRGCPDPSSLNHYRKFSSMKHRLRSLGIATPRTMKAGRLGPKKKPSPLCASSKHTSAPSFAL